MKTLCLFLGFFALVHMQGQKLIKKALINENIKHIQINSQFCYQVNISTSKTEEVTVKAKLEGEYSKDLLISIEEDGSNLIIGARFHPNFIHPNDKLSAHKVISIGLEVNLPEYKDVFLYGTSSNVNVRGKYKKLKVKLSDGKCNLNNVVETVEVVTQKGDILLTTTDGNIIAKSTYGKVHQETIPKGHNQFVLNTVEGEIRLRKTK